MGIRQQSVLGVQKYCITAFTAKENSVLFITTSTFDSDSFQIQISLEKIPMQCHFYQHFKNPILKLLLSPLLLSEPKKGHLWPEHKKKSRWDLLKPLFKGFRIKLWDLKLQRSSKRHFKEQQAHNKDILCTSSQILLKVLKIVCIV